MPAYAALVKQPQHPTGAALGRQPFFRGLTWLQLDSLAAVAACAEFAPGEEIFREGEAANRFYLLLTGRVALEAAAGDRRVRLQVLEAEEVLGWSWLFPPYRWHFSARALEPVTAFFFHGPALHERCEGDPALGYGLMKRVSALMLERLEAMRTRLAVVERAAAGETIHLALLAPGGGGS